MVTFTPKITKATQTVSAKQQFSRQGSINHNAGIQSFAQDLGQIGVQLSARAARQTALDENEQNRVQAEGERQRKEYENTQIKAENFRRETSLNDFHTAMTKASMEAKENAVGPAENFAKTMDENYEKASREWISKNVREEDRERFEARLAQTKRAVLSDSLQFEYSQKHAHYRENIKLDLDKRKSVLDQNPEKLAEQQQEFMQLLNASDLPESAKGALARDAFGAMASVVYKREFQRKIVRGRSLGVGAGTKLPALKSVLSRVDIGTLPQGYVERLAEIESSGNPNARNGKHEGLFQMSPAYAKDYGVTNRRDVDDSTRGVIRGAQQQQAALKQFLNREPSAGELYLAHQQGLAGARKLLSNPNALAKDIVGAAAVKENRGKLSMTAGEFADMWINKFEGGSTVDETSDEFKPVADIPLRFVKQPGRVSNPSADGTDPAVLDRLQKVQNALGMELPIVSAARSESVNKKAGGASKSRHIHGDALDLDVAKYSRAERLVILDKLSAAGFTGIGIYDNSIHVDTGKRRTWGKSHGKDSNPSWAKDFIDRHMGRKTGGSSQGYRTLEADPRFAVIPYEDRVALRADSDRAAAAELAAAQKAQTAALNAQRDSLYTSIAYGESGRSELDAAIETGLLDDFDHRKKAEKLLEDKLKADKDGTAAAQKYFTAGALWNKNDPDDKKMLETLVEPEQITPDNPSYFTDTVVPVVDNTRIVPKNVAGVLESLAKGDTKQMAFAYDGMQQLRAVNPEAFREAFDDRLEMNTQFYDDRKDLMPKEQIMERIQWMNDPRNKNDVDIIRQRSKEFLVDNPPEAANIVDEIWSSYFASDPTPPENTMQKLAMEREYRVAFEDAMLLYQSPEEAKEAAKKAIKRNWGPTVRPEDRGYIWNSPKIMKYPPAQAGYQKREGNMDWLWNQFAKERKPAEGENLELIADDQTKAEIDKGIPASYLVGRSKDGTFAIDPERIFFEPTETDIKKDQTFNAVEDLRQKQISVNRRMQTLVAGGAGNNQLQNPAVAEELEELIQEKARIAESMELLDPKKKVKAKMTQETIDMLRSYGYTEDGAPTKKAIR